MKASTTPQKVGPYRIEERLGAGGMGAVYRAYDERLDRWVALKQIRQDKATDARFRERFLREARVAARLNHPAVVHIHDVLDTEDGDWIVMELVDGIPLAHLLETEGPLEVGRAVLLAKEIASGLAAAHSAGVIHRDLKTENVVIDGDGAAKVLDFGLAKTVDPDAETSSLTSGGRILGTPRAMSPEQVQGQELDFRSDLFSLGILLYEMMTGKSPFKGPAPAMTLARICHHQQDPAQDLVPGLPEELSVLIDRLLAKDPRSRPRGAAEVVERLQQITVDTMPTGEPRKALPARPVAEIADEGGPEAGNKPFHLHGERRQLTVMCCELTGTALDPDILLKVVPPFQRLAADAIKRYQGHLWDTQGHRLIACFGYPRSYEDNARRAVLTALEIVDRTAAMESGVHCRVGVYSGPAVLRTHDKSEHLTLGETLNLATYLQEEAAPGTVVAGITTRRLIRGFFDEEKLDSQSVRALSAQLERYRILASREFHSRLEATAEPPPLIGREHELGLLEGRWKIAREGAGQALLVTGESGIGKSRLLRAFQDRLPETDPTALWIPAQGSPYAFNQPLYLLPGLLHRLLKLDTEAAVEDRVDRLAGILDQHGFPPADTVPLFSVLLGLPGAEWQALGLAELREATLEAVPTLVLEMAEQRPLILAVEDLQWVDPTTLEVIGRLIDQVSTSALLLVLTCRPGFRSPWGQKASLTLLSLGPLDSSESALLIDQLTAEKDLAPQLRQQLIAFADGIPLFAEELVRDTLSIGAVDLLEATVPDLLHDSLSARLDRLGSSKKIIQIASSLEREFSLQRLATLSGLDESTLDQELDQLVTAEILVRQRPSADPIFSFKHALVRAAAAASLLAEDGERLNRRTRSAQTSFRE